MLLHEGLLDRLEPLVNSDMNPVKYLSIDPGKSNGCCGYDERFHLVFMYTVPADSMIKFINCFEQVQLCIIENFILFPGKRTEQNWSDMQTSRIIGNVETWAENKKIELIKQGPNVKKTGYAWLGMKSPSKSNPANHELDAHCHFTYWAVKNGKINAADLIKKSTSDGAYLERK